MWPMTTRSGVHGGGSLCGPFWAVTRSPSFLLTLAIFIVFSTSAEGFSNCPKEETAIRPPNGVCPSVLITSICHFGRLYECRVIEGSLQIRYIFENESLKNVSFSTLREIRGFLLIYKLNSSVALSSFFPNLAVIRGEDLIHSFAVVIFKNPNLVDQVLPSLRLIGRGLVFNETTVDTCPQRLESPGPVLENLFTPPSDQTCVKCLQDLSLSEDAELCEDQSVCSTNCSNSCRETCKWIPEECCHPLCLGGCVAPKNPFRCVACRYFSDDGECITKCPPFKLRFGHACVNREFCWSQNLVIKPDTKECLDIQPKGDLPPLCPPGYKFQAMSNSCSPCHEEDKCLSPCDSPTIQHVDDALPLRNCEVITGSLVIKVYGGNFVAEELEKNLGQVKEVEGFVELTNISVKSVNFLKSLMKIRGTYLHSNEFSLVIHDNENLEDLKPWVLSGLKILRGGILVKKNPRLCLSAIDKFISSLRLPRRLDISNVSNGITMSCKPSDLAAELSNSSMAGTLEVTISHPRNVSYLIQYKATEEHLSVEAKSDSCERGWELVDVKPQDTKGLTYYIRNLIPFKRYAVFVHTIGQKGSLASNRSQILYSHTNSYNPSNPREVEAVSDLSSTLHVRWKVPQFPNGPKVYYFVQLKMKDIIPDPSILNICGTLEGSHVGLQRMQLAPIKRQRRRREGDRGPTKEEIMATFSATSGPKKGTPTTCTTHRIPEEEEEEEKQAVFSWNHISNTRMQRFPTYEVFQPIPISLPKCSLPSVYSRRICPNKIQTSFTNYTFRNLKPGGLYTISVFACQKPVDCPTAYPTDKCQHCANKCQLCSRPETVVKQIITQEDADRVLDSSIMAVVQDSPEKGIYISFEAPTSPNSQILTFLLLFRITDGFGGEIRRKCVTFSEFQFKKNLSLFYDDLPYGNLSLRVQTLTIMNSTLSSPVYFFNPYNKKSDWSGYSILMGAFVFVATVAASSLGCNYYLRRKEASIPVSDEFLKSIGETEIMNLVDGVTILPLENLQIKEFLDRGHFGIVNKGVLRSPDDPEKPVVVKTPKSWSDKKALIRLIREARVMQKLGSHDCIVKGYGLVVSEESDDTRIYCVMEHMTNGSLRNYLKRCSTQVWSAKMMVWAMHASCGMSYLVAKKFIHRDLAARNCLLDGQLNVKIADFEHAIYLGSPDVYLNSHDTSGGKPFCWMAPESLLADVFTDKSDLWSYGVLLWEIVTKGKVPFEGKERQEVIEYVTQRKQTLTIPPGTIEPFVSIMQMCWSFNPAHRPPFSAILKEWTNIIESSDDFDHSNPVQIIESSDDFDHSNPVQIIESSDDFEHSNPVQSRKNTFGASFEDEMSKRVFFSGDKFQRRQTVKKRGKISDALETTERKLLFGDTINSSTKSTEDDNETGSGYSGECETSFYLNIDCACCSSVGNAAILAVTSTISPEQCSDYGELTVTSTIPPEQCADCGELTVTSTIPSGQCGDCGELRELPILNKPSSCQSSKMYNCSSYGNIADTSHYIRITNR